MEGRKEQPMLSKEEFLEKVRQVGAVLNMELEDKGDQWSRNYAVLKNGTKEISFSNGDYQLKDKFHISGNYPRNYKREYMVYSYSEKSPSINVSEKKSPEQIAKDIQRRFLPAYEELLKTVLERVESSNGAHDNRCKALQKLGEVVGVEPGKDSQGEPGLWVHDTIPGLKSVEARYDGDIHIELELDVEKAVNVIAYLKALSQPGQV
jgi:hypothetical protein